MESWWRVLRGVWPYRWMVTISIICALGVGLSYASGVAVMLPVMKIFVSTEGVHGWAYRTTAEKRLDVKILDQDTSVRRGKLGLTITDQGSKTPQPLQMAKGEESLRITSVTTSLGQVHQNDPGAWNKMVGLIAQATPDETLALDIVPPGAAAPQTVKVTAASIPWYTQIFVKIIRWLPESNRFLSLLYVVLFFIFLCIVGSIFRYWQQFLGMTVANRVVMDLRRRMYDRVVALPTAYCAQKGTSDLMSRLTQDTNTLTDGVSMALGKAIQEPMKAAFAFGLAWWIDWRLCLGAVVTMPILGLIIRKFSKRMRRAARGALESWAQMLAIINETLIGARVVKAYSAEGFERRRFTRVNKKLLKEQIKMNHYSSLSRPTIETMAVVLISMPMLWAAYYVLNGMLDREAFLTLLACFAAMIEPLRKLSDVNAKVQQTNAAGTRIFEVIDTPIEPNHNHQLPKLPRHQKTVEFRDVIFKYPGHEEIVLKGVSFTANRGQTVAIVGGNGSGKTTLLNLLPRLYVPTSGQILIDGQDIADVSIRSLRKQIGLVTQDTLLFADSIFNNIAYGLRHATESQVFDAAKRAYADEFIRGLPEGYATMVGEHGVRLSGGQKQRIAIARAILHDPSILILDEAMSQIDADSEMKISLALREFTKSRTVFMIAHRFQTVISADAIVCLDLGKVVGIGTHQELISNCPAYRRLYENQFREVAVDKIEAPDGNPVLNA